MNDVEWADLVQSIRNREVARDGFQRRRHDPRRGRLEELAEWVAAAHGTDVPRPLTRVVVALAAPDRDDRQADRVHRLAALVGATVRNVELPDFEPVEEALRRGLGVAEEQADAGADLLVATAPLGADSVAVSTLVGLLTNQDASRVTDTALDDATWAVTCAAIRDAMRRTRPSRGNQRELLVAAGSREVAALAGLVLGAAARRTPVLLDGVTAAAAALVAHRASFRASDWWLAGDVTRHPVHDLALKRLGLEPLLELSPGPDELGSSLLAVPLLRAATDAA